MRWLAVYTWVYLTGYLVFTGQAVFDDYHSWDTAYFIWAAFAHAGAFTWVAIYYTVHPKVSRKVMPPMLYACSIFLWEVISLLTGIPVNNQYVVMVEFLLALGVITYLIIIDLK